MFAITTLAIYLGVGSLSLATFIAASAVAFVAFFAESIPQFVADYAAAQDRRRGIREEVEAAEPFLAHLGVRVSPRAFVEAHTKLAFSEPLMLSVPERILEEEFSGCSEGQRRILLVLLLCDRWKAGGLAPGVCVRMHQLILGLFEAIVRQEGLRKDFAHAYMAIRDQIGSRSKPGVHVGFESLFAEADDDPLREAAILDFINRYAMEERFQYIRRALNNSEELRHALKSLIESGALDRYGVSSQALRSIEKRLRDRPLKPGAFLILKNRWEELNPFIDSLPSLRGSGGAVVRNFDLGTRSRGHLVSVSVVKPQGGYSSAKEFAGLELLPRISTSEGFLAVFGLDTYDSFTSSSQGDLGRTIAENYRVVSTLKTGYAETDVDVWSEINRAAVPLVELLKHLPFTVFVDDLGPDERACLAEHYDQVKEEFFIEQITDWATIDSASLASALRALPRTALHGNRADQVAAQVVERSQAFAESSGIRIPET